jgi:hypothetical protein
MGAAGPANRTTLSGFCSDESPGDEAAIGAGAALEDGTEGAAEGAAFADDGEDVPKFDSCAAGVETGADSSALEFSRDSSCCWTACRCVWTTSIACFN